MSRRSAHACRRTRLPLLPPPCTRPSHISPVATVVARAPVARVVVGTPVTPVARATAATSAKAIASRRVRRNNCVRRSLRNVEDGARHSRRTPPMPVMPETPRGSASSVGPRNVSQRLREHFGNEALPPRASRKKRAQLFPKGPHSRDSASERPAQSEWRFRKTRAIGPSFSTDPTRSPARRTRPTSSAHPTAAADKPGTTPTPDTPPADKLGKTEDSPRQTPKKEGSPRPTRKTEGSPRPTRKKNGALFSESVGS